MEIIKENELTKEQKTALEIKGYWYKSHIIDGRLISDIVLIDKAGLLKSNCHNFEEQYKITVEED